jgi:opacity protein-like surface antigen
MKIFFLILSFILFSTQSFAMMTELGLSYSYQKKNFNSTNYYQTETKTASLSLYLFEKIALELSYTDSFYENQEKDANTSRVLQQTSNISGADLIFILTDQQSLFQPYLKGGVAYIHKKAIIKYENADAFHVPTKDGVAPSYGLGLKYKLTESLSIKIGYDVWQTPMDDGTKTDDTAFKSGLSWYL